jgi:MFS superfamily sulfate permease-like transporter
MNWLRQRVRFDRNELSGAFGDIGTDFPLLVGMILAAGLDAPSVLIIFGAMQVITGLAYGMPMPVQPLKAMAVIVITQKLAPNVLYGGGLAIGAVMLLLTLTGLIGWVARIVPKSVVRGVQFGLGMQLASLALRDYVTSDGWPGYALAFVAFALTLALLGNRRFPPAPFIILLGIAYALLFKLDGGAFAHAVGISLPKLHTPQWADVLTGFLVLALPQLPLSLGNSILASQRVAEDLFPEKRVTVRKISLTYSLMNLVSPFFSGVPTCHGSGGIAGHYAFGGRTGGSVVIYGALYLTLGLFFGGGFSTAVKLFPLPVLGVILLFEALALMKLVRDMLSSAADFFIVLLVGLIAFGLPYGYVIGVVLGTLIVYFGKRILQPPTNTVL